MIRPERCRPRADRLVVGQPAVVQLLDPGQQEDLVVHRQPEAERQQQSTGMRGLDPADRGEAEQAAQVAVLEDPDHHAERRPERGHVHQQRLQRHQHRAGHQEQQHERGQHDQGHRVGRALLGAVRGSRPAGRSDPVTQVGASGTVLADLTDQPPCGVGGVGRRRCDPDHLDRAVPAGACLGRADPGHPGQRGHVTGPRPRPRRRAAGSPRSPPGTAHAAGSADRGWSNSAAGRTRPAAGRRPRRRISHPQRRQRRARPGRPRQPRSPARAARRCTRRASREKTPRAGRRRRSGAAAQAGHPGQRARAAASALPASASSAGHQGQRHQQRRPATTLTPAAPTARRIRPRRAAARSG